MITKQKVSQFFEQPRGFFARFVQVIIITFILLSVVAFLVETFYSSILQSNQKEYLHLLEIVAVTIFSIEYALRLWAAPSRGRFIINFYSIIDLLAILPFFLLESNFAFIRALRVLRLLRASKLFRVAKIMRPIWDVSKEKMVSIVRIVQENVVKNIIVIVVLIFVYKPIQEFVGSINPEFFGDITFATSIFVLAAMFGFFSLSYSDFNNEKLGNRLLIHLTSAMLMWPIGVMFIVIQHVLTLQIGSTPTLLVVPMWFVYGAVVLWDFSNVKKVEERLEK
ncbi:ion transporter [Candidatus Parcubacteria bacterium]|jgi:voltage-gated potassium channel|nr:ion transporter [Candidatus Parcubacteria bacterium]MBT3948984.1 ion transporter [Candidatus Parcubacteria bacterium]